MNPQAVRHGDIIRHKEVGTEAVVVGSDCHTFEEHGIRVKTVEDDTIRFLPYSRLDQFERVDTEGGA